MKVKLCQRCKVNPPSFVTRRDKDSPKVFICPSCVHYYVGQVIVSYSPEVVKSLKEEIGT